MTKTITSAEFGCDLNEFLQKYKYQPTLTAKLDNVEMTRFTQTLVNEIVLWKIDRFVQLTDELLAEIENVKTLSHGKHRDAEFLIHSLLKIRGVDLAMASTILRFRNPTVFQIIDRHAYRAVYGSKLPLYSTSPPMKKIGVYFDYLDELIRLCATRNLEFGTVDRILYQFDKDTNGKLD